MSPDGRLREYPYIVVRLACRECPIWAGTASLFSPSALAGMRIWRPCWRLFRRAALASWKATPGVDAVRIILTCPQPSRRTRQPISGRSGCG